MARLPIENAVTGPAQVKGLERGGLDAILFANRSHLQEEPIVMDR